MGKYFLSFKGNDFGGQITVVDARVSKIVSSNMSEKIIPSYELFIRSEKESLTPPVQWPVPPAVSYSVSKNKALAN